MSRRIRIDFDGPAVVAELNDSAAAEALLAALPLSARVSTWGEEIYFPIGRDLGPCDAPRTEMDVGQIAYWPPGQAFCVFFGPTPASGPDGTPRAASEVQPLGRVLDGIEPLRTITDGRKVTISAEP